MSAQSPWPDMSVTPSAAYFAPVRLAAVSVSRWHASISTTADTYTDWDVQQLESSLLRTFAVEDDGE